MKKRFTKKGKKMFNLLIKKLGKKEARRWLYSMERHHPDVIKRWRE